MQLVEALTIAGEQNHKCPEWIISGPCGQLSKVNTYYTAKDADGNPICLSNALENVIAGLVERTPQATRDEQWELKPYISK